MKCKHEKCGREAIDSDGYCNRCLQVDTKECSECSGSEALGTHEEEMVGKEGDIEIVEENVGTEEEAKKFIERGRKHNRWIDGLAKGAAFFKWCEYLGLGLLLVVGLYTIMAYWVGVAVPVLGQFNFSSLAVLMIKLTQLSASFLFLGVIFKWFCRLLSDWLYAKELEVLRREGVARYAS